MAKTRQKPAADDTTVTPVAEPDRVIVDRLDALEATDRTHEQRLHAIESWIKGTPVADAD